jgi:hypothetical protein
MCLKACLSAPTRSFPAPIFVKRPSRFQGYGAGERFRSIEKFSGHIRNLTRDLPACSIVQLGYLEVTVQEKLRSGWAGPFMKVEGCCDQSFVCFQSEQTSQVVIKVLRSPVLHSPPHLSACWSSPHHYPYFSYSASEDCHV